MLPKDIVSQLLPKEGELPPPPTGLQEVLTVLCFTSILLPRGIIRLSAGSIIFSLCLYIVFFTEEQSRKGYLLGVSCSVLIYRWIDLVAFHFPERDCWKVEKNVDGTVNATAPQDYWGKLKWSFFLWNNQRGVGWNIEPENLPAPVPYGYSQSTFLLGTFKNSVWAYVGELVTKGILKVGYFYCLERYSWDDHAYQFFNFPLPAQIIISWATAFKLYYRIKILYNAGALVTVPLGIYTPQDWPPIFGSFLTDGWSVRSVWGRCWHQMFRRPCSEAGKAVKDAFGFLKGGFMSRYSQVWVGFAVSALAHQAGAKVGMYQDGGHFQFVYFMVQPAGIMLEDGIMGIGRMVGIKSSERAKLTGKIWALLWFSWSLRFMVAYQPTSWLVDEGIIPFGKANASLLTSGLAVKFLTPEHWKLGWLFDQPIWK